jgi:hypothetical protein
MLLAINIAANAIVFAATLWALLSNNVPFKTPGAVLLMAIAFGAFGNMVSPNACHSEPEVLFNVAIALASIRFFWSLEARAWFFKQYARRREDAIRLTGKI